MLIWCAIYALSVYAFRRDLPCNDVGQELCLHIVPEGPGCVIRNRTAEQRMPSKSALHLAQVFGRRCLHYTRGHETSRGCRGRYAICLVRLRYPVISRLFNMCPNLDASHRSCSALDALVDRIFHSLVEHRYHLPYHACCSPSGVSEWEPAEHPDPPLARRVHMFASHLLLLLTTTPRWLPTLSPRKCRRARASL